MTNYLDNNREFFHHYTAHDVLVDRFSKRLLETVDSLPASSVHHSVEDEFVSSLNALAAAEQSFFIQPGYLSAAYWQYAIDQHNMICKMSETLHTQSLLLHPATEKERPAYRTTTQKAIMALCVQKNLCPSETVTAAARLYTAEEPPSGRKQAFGACCFTVANYLANHQCLLSHLGDPQTDPVLHEIVEFQIDNCRTKQDLTTTAKSLLDDAAIIAAHIHPYDRSSQHRLAAKTNSCADVTVGL